MVNFHLGGGELLAVGKFFVFIDSITVKNGGTVPKYQQVRQCVRRKLTEILSFQGNSECCLRKVRWPVIGIHVLYVVEK
jgi:hypothetical protein